MNSREVMNCFMEDFMPKCPTDNHVKAYLQHLLKIYTSNASTFPSKLWAEAIASLTRATNGCELFHSDFNQLFY